MLVKVIFAVIIMAMYIYYFDSSIELYLESSLLERSILISKTITISVALYFLTLYTLGVRLKQL